MPWFRTKISFIEQMCLSHNIQMIVENKSIDTSDKDFALFYLILFGA